ncbi:MAG: hypothetical protein ACT4OE_10850 [Sphingosinicella sp.]
MNAGPRLRIGALLAVALLAGCASRPAPAPQPAPPPAARPVPVTPGVLTGLAAAALTARFGRPDLEIREGRARKLQFANAAGVLDVYLYPPQSGREPAVTHVDARRPDGRDMDVADCVAALSPQPPPR